jgi:signal transduction histidine kinase
VAGGDLPVTSDPSPGGGGPVTRGLQAWFPDAALGGVVLALGCWEAAGTGGPAELWSWQLLVPVGFAAAAGLSRRAPGLALAVVWATCEIQVAAGLDVMAVELAVAVVAFGTARWGSTLTVWLSAVSIPLAVAIAIAFVASDGIGALVGITDYRTILDGAGRLGLTWRIGAGLAVTAVLGAPWLAGLALRSAEGARASRVLQVRAEADKTRAQLESEQAREIARLREDQARLARDVHDTVGHSLAVILAQAESAQYLSSTDATDMKKTMTNIAASARSSLRDVREVLTSTGDSAVHPGGLDALVDGVRSSHHEVVSTVVGTPQRLAPDLQMVAYRVLQEMLTNAIKHGCPDGAIVVERHWGDQLRIEVRNTLDATVRPDPSNVGVDEPPGLGLAGMRRRLEAVGGRLDARRADAAGELSFVATASIPVRAQRR